MQIEDGGHTGRKAGVDLHGNLRTRAITSTTEHQANVNGDAYHFQFEVTPSAADDCILFMQNLSDTNLVVEGAYLSPGAACEIYMQSHDVGTRNAAVAAVPAQCNFESGHSADGTFETGVDLDGGAATLADGIEFERYAFRAASNSSYFNFEQDIIIPKNGTFTVWVNDAVEIIGTLVMNYHDHGEA